MALKRGLVEPPGEGMGPGRAWSRRQSRVNPLPVTGDLEVLTVQAGPEIPLRLRGVVQAIGNAKRTFCGRGNATPMINARLLATKSKGAFEPRAVGAYELRTQIKTRIEATSI